MPRSVATNTSVDRDAMLDFVRPRHRMLVITYRKDGTAQLSPVSGGVDADGRIVVATYPVRAKVSNARHRGRGGVLVLSDEWNGPWLQVDGDWEVLDLPEALEPLVDYFRAISGEHDDWEEYRQAMREQGKCLLRLTATRWGPVATGGFPAHLA